MAAPERMRHMLLGDVGTGKTMVAAFALVMAADSGEQALMMGPTEVLVDQYAQGLGPVSYTHLRPRREPRSRA